MQECINLSGLLHLTKTIAPGEIYAHRFAANGGVQTLLSELAGTEDEVRCGGSAVKVVSMRHITQPDPGRSSEIEVFLEGVRYLNDSDLMKETEPPAIKKNLLDIAEALGLESSPVPNGLISYPAEVDGDTHFELMRTYAAGTEVICGAVVCEIRTFKSRRGEKFGLYEITIGLLGIRYATDSEQDAVLTINQSRTRHEPPLAPIPNGDVPTQPFLMPAFEKHIHEFTERLYETTKRVIDGITKQQAATDKVKLDETADAIVRANKRAWDTAFKAIEENRAWASAQLEKLAYTSNDIEDRIGTLEELANLGSTPFYPPPSVDNDEAPSVILQRFMKEGVLKDPVKHDFGKWLGLKPIELEAGILVNRTIDVEKKTADLLEHYYKIGQQFRVGSVIVFIYELFTLTCSCEDDGRKTHTITMKLEIKRLLPEI